MKIQHLLKEVENKGKFSFLITLLSVLAVLNTQANNIVVNIANPATDIDQTNGYVTFTLSWNNSWGTKTASNNSTTAVNWDAAWVFVKWRDCSSALTTQFTHGLVSTVVSDHTFNVDAGATTFEPTDHAGNAPAIDGGPNNTGVMLRNAANNAPGSVSAKVKLKLNNLPTTGSLDFRIYAIEMVFVPQGPFILGDGNGSNASLCAFADVPNGVSPFSIANENAQSIFDRSDPSGGIYICPSGTCALTASFPKGFSAFYIMKHEISQGEYTDFLNAIPSYAQNVHWNIANVSLNRYTITQPTTGVFSTTRPHRACNWLSWPDVAAYLQWAALRPLTEMEYEKACRGVTTSVLYEAAWGTATAVRATATSMSGTEDGTETITTTNANVGYNGTWTTNSDGGSGPIRDGIFATGSSNRVTAGMSFYGALDLSGNVAEYFICTVSGISGQPSATGVSLSDGQLDATSGYATISNWPLKNTTVNGTTTGTMLVIRRGGHYIADQTTGGSTYTNGTYFNVSDRYQSAYNSGVPSGYNFGTYGSNHVLTRNAQTGGRGGR